MHRSSDINEVKERTVFKRTDCHTLGFCVHIACASEKITLTGAFFNINLIGGLLLVAVVCGKIELSVKEVAALNLEQLVVHTDTADISEAAVHVEHSYFVDIVKLREIKNIVFYRAPGDVSVALTFLGNDTVFDKFESVGVIYENGRVSEAEVLTGDIELAFIAAAVAQVRIPLEH